MSKSRKAREKHRYYLNQKIVLMKQFDDIRDNQKENKAEWKNLKKLWSENETILKSYKDINTEIVGKYWDGQFSHEVTKNHKICICTNVMGRVKDLSKTLPKNIETLKAYPNVEFNLLNYGDKDGLDDWVKKNMMEHIESGLLKYYKVLDDINFYSMSHSRNICIRLAGGLDNASHDIIVNQVDCDNDLKATNANADDFATHVNKLAHELPEKAIFGKGKRLMHGRIGFYKDEFLMLGGYDEGLVGYGHDDRDLYNRAMLLGHSLAWYGGTYCRRIHTPIMHKVQNMKFKDYRYTEDMNKLISLDNLEDGKYIANTTRHWGKAKILKNFKEEFEM